MGSVSWPALTLSLVIPLMALGPPHYNTPHLMPPRVSVPILPRSHSDSAVTKKALSPSIDPSQLHLLQHPVSSSAAVADSHPPPPAARPPARVICPFYALAVALAEVILPPSRVVRPSVLQSLSPNRCLF